jgi:hypothetical protein
LGIVVLATSGRTFVAQWVGEWADNHRQARFANGRFPSKCLRTQQKTT